MLRLLARVGLLIGLFVVLLILVRGVGGQVKSPLRDMFTESILPNGGRQICWHGICPGRTTIGEATAILQADQTFRSDPQRRPLCWESRAPIYRVCLDRVRNEVGGVSIGVTYGSHFANGIGFDPALHLSFRLADVMAMWGIPLRMSNPHCQTSSLVFGDQTTVNVTWVPRSTQPPLWALDRTQSQVIGFILTVPLQNSADKNYMPRAWEGFVTTSTMSCFDE